MLPIFKKIREKKQPSPGLIVKERAGNEPNSSDIDMAKELCGHRLLAAIRDNDALAVGEALYQAAQDADAEPHEEGPHIEPHSYAAQNLKAGQE